MHDNSPWNPNSKRVKKLEHYNETHEHNPKTGYLEKKKSAKSEALKKKKESRADKVGTRKKDIAINHQVGNWMKVMKGDR